MFWSEGDGHVWDKLDKFFCKISACIFKVFQVYLKNGME